MYCAIHFSFRWDFFFCAGLRIWYSRGCAWMCVRFYRATYNEFLITKLQRILEYLQSWFIVKIKNANKILQLSDIEYILFLFLYKKNYAIISTHICDNFPIRISRSFSFLFRKFKVKSTTFMLMGKMLIKSSEIIRNLFPCKYKNINFNNFSTVAETNLSRKLFERSRTSKFNKLSNASDEISVTISLERSKISKLAMFRLTFSNFDNPVDSTTNDFRFLMCLIDLMGGDTSSKNLQYEATEYFCQIFDCYWNWGLKSTHSRCLWMFCKCIPSCN